VSDEWQLLLSARVMAFVLDQPPRARRRLVDMRDAMRRHPVLRPDDLPRQDSRGRVNHLRFVDGVAVLFWIDPADRTVQVLEVGWQ
jgi:hypothetical protein